MSEAYLTHSSFGGKTPDTRNHFHEVALREARIASEYGQVKPESPVKDSLLARIRLALAGPSATDACGCPA